MEVATHRETMILIDHYCKRILRGFVLRQLPLGLAVREENPSYLIWINVMGWVDVKGRLALGQSGTISP